LPAGITTQAVPRLVDCYTRTPANTGRFVCVLLPARSLLMYV